MHKRGLIIVSLLVGCAVGVGARQAVQVVLPEAHAGGPHPYAYRVVKTNDLMATVASTNAAFKGAGAPAVLEEGLNGFGRAGWRLVGAFGLNGEWLAFEMPGAEAPTTTPAAQH